MSVISYIDPLIVSTILTGIYYLPITLSIFLNVRSVESLELGPHLFSVALPIEQNINQKDHVSLLIQPH